MIAKWREVLETSLSYQLNIEIVFSSASKMIHFHVKRKRENADIHAYTHVSIVVRALTRYKEFS